MPVKQNNTTLIGWDDVPVHIQARIIYGYYDYERGSQCGVQRADEVDLRTRWLHIDHPDDVDIPCQHDLEIPCEDRMISIRLSLHCARRKGRDIELIYAVNLRGGA